jgi:diguanylate cyclase (GGDEF)-like protein/PAS domain S-box-containing protein
MARRTQRRAPATKSNRSLLTSLSSDWHWEQDAAHRVTRIERESGLPLDAELKRALLGKRHWEAGIEVEGGWAAHRALLEAHAPFRDALMCGQRADGSRFYLSISGEPVFDRGRFAGYRGFARDVTGQKRTEVLLRLQHNVTADLAEASDAAQGIVAALRSICEAESWDCGQFWRVDSATGVARRFAYWVVPGVKPAQDYAEAWREKALQPGQSLIGAAWESGEPLWIEDTAKDPRAQRATVAKQTGLRGALLLPVPAGGRIVGVLSFVCRRIRRPDDAMLHALTALATQLGLFLRRAEAEAGLRQNEERFRRTFELAAVGVAHIGLDRRFERVNRRLCEILGYPEQELIGITGGEISHPEDKDLLNAQRTRLHAGEIEALRGEKRYIRKDGSVVWCAYTLAVERDAAGKPLYEIAVYDDISARRAMEDALRNSEARFRQVVDSANEGILVYDRDLSIVTANAAAARIVGVPLERLIGRPGFTSLFRCLREDGSPLAPDDRPTKLTTRLGEPLTGMVVGLVREGGDITWLSVNTGFLRRPGESEHYGIVSTISDISGRRRTELQLRENEGRFRGLTQLSSDWFWEQDPQYRFTRLEGPNVAGGDVQLRERLIGAPRWESGLEIEGGWDAHRALLEARKPFHEALMWRTTSEGEIRFVRVSGEPVFGADGEFHGYRGVGRDVTKEKRAEQLLRLEHRVASALSEAKTAEAGVASVLRLVCEAEGWGCGRYFELDRAGDAAIYRQGWSAPGAGLEAFLSESRGLRYKRGESLVGLVVQNGEPVWSTDTRSDARVQAGLRLPGPPRGAFLFGAAAEAETIGVLGFTSPAVRKPDQRLLAAARVIGAQIGQFLRRMQAEAQLRQSEARFRSLTEMSSDFFWETDTEHRFVSMVHGPQYPEHTGRIIGVGIWDLPYLHPDEAAWAEQRARMEAHKPFRDFEFGRRWRDGTVRYFLVHGDPHFAADGSFLGYRGVGRDVTDLALARERIASLAYHDALTGLDNRASLVPSLERAIERTRRRATRLAGLFLDLDGFKEVNDLHGHDAGDRLLIEAARRLRAALRSSDPVARLGGDEFFVVLEDINDAGPAERVAQKLLGELARPYDIGTGRSVRISVSIGASLFPDDAGDGATLVKHADAAMYAAKQAGKNAYRFFAARPAANDSRDKADSRDEAGSRNEEGPGRLSR